MEDKCNCGRPVRYTVLDAQGNLIGSCNKYKQCLSYDDLYRAHLKLKDDYREMVSIANNLRTYREGTDVYQESERELDRVLIERGMR